MLDSYECCLFDFLALPSYKSSTGLSGNLFLDMFSLHIIKREINRAYIIKKERGL